MTEREAIENHRKMWKWIAIQTLKQKRIVQKEGYLINTEYIGIDNDCFCCEYTKRYNDNCVKCPIDWCSVNNHCCDDGTLYEKWLECSINDDYRESAYLAYKISKLPGRENV